MKYSFVITSAAHELGFWKGFVKTPRFLDGWVKPVKTPELHQEIYEHLMTNQGRVLDIGSGVVSILNGTVPVERLVATDPLSPLYEFVFDYAHHGIKPPLPVPGEELEFIENFDTVHISNALDHCENPVKTMHKAHQALRPGGVLIVCGFVNEGTAMGRRGMHQWDLNVNERKLELRYPNDSKVLQFWTGDRTLCKKIDGGREWFIWFKTKRRDED